MKCKNHDITDYVSQVFVLLMRNSKLQVPSEWTSGVTRSGLCILTSHTAAEHHDDQFRTQTKAVRKPSEMVTKSEIKTAGKDHLRRFVNIYIYIYIYIITYI